MRRPHRSLVIVMNAMLSVLLAVSLLTLVPAAVANPDPTSPGQDASVQEICIDVDTSNSPPVEVYHCPWTDDA